MYILFNENHMPSNSNWTEIAKSGRLYDLNYSSIINEYNDLHKVSRIIVKERYKNNKLHVIIQAEWILEHTIGNFGITVDNWYFENFTDAMITKLWLTNYDRN